MKAQNILGGDIEDLKELRDIVQNQMNIQDGIEQTNIEYQKLQKEAEAEEKLMNDNIQFTIKKRREQIVINFDNEISKFQDKLKKVKNERDKKKDKEVKKRISEETKDLVSENKNIKEEYRTYMAQNGLSKVWDNKLFYSLFFPRRISEFIIFMIFWVVGVIAIPALFCDLMGQTFWLLKTLVVLIYAVLFILVYAFVYRFAKDDYKEYFMYVRGKQALIESNNKKIAAIKRDIRRDKDEQQYNLEKYDKEIGSIQENIEDVVSRKNEALNEFDKNTSVEIGNEIYKHDMVSIQEKRQRISELSKYLKDNEDKLKEINLDISTNYAAYLGTENLTLDKIDGLLAIMSQQDAKTVGDAINISKSISNTML